MYKNSGIVEHVAVPVTDINWHIDFFENVFGMSINKIKGAQENPEIAWLSGGIQLMRKCGAGNKVVDHLGIVVSDLNIALTQLQGIKAVSPIPGKEPHWVLLPDGIILELIQGNAATIQGLMKNPLR